MANRIREWRERRGLSQPELAERANTTKAQISKLEKGARRLTHDWMNRLARPLGITPAELLPASVETVMIRGAVQAGHFAEAAEWPPDEWQAAYALADPRYPGFERFALLVRGRSMDQVYPEGSVLICISFIALDRPPRAQERVICHRRDRHGLWEATVKQLEQDGEGQWWLVPKSSDPALQQPIRVESPIPGDDENEDLRITALVVGSFKFE